MTAPDPGLTDLIAAHLRSHTWGNEYENAAHEDHILDGGCKICRCDVDAIAARALLVVEQHTNGRIAELRDVKAERDVLKATIARVEEAVNTAAAHRFDFDNTGIEGPGGKVGGPNNFFNGNRYVTNYVRAALEGE